MEDSKLLTLKPVVEATPIEDIQQIIKYLFEGRILRVDQQDEGTILVRTGGKHKLTEISWDINKESFYYSRHWLPYNVSINALITYNVYLDDEFVVHKSKFKVGDIVEYERQDQEPEQNFVDVAKVKSVLKDDAVEGYYYQLSGDTTIYKEEHLTKVK